MLINYEFQGIKMLLFSLYATKAQNISFSFRPKSSFYLIEFERQPFCYRRRRKVLSRSLKIIKKKSDKSVDVMQQPQLEGLLETV